MRELAPREAFADALSLSEAIKALPLTLIKPRPIDEAISTAGGVTFEAMDERLMLRQLPGVFCAGEMLDWEAQPAVTCSPPASPVAAQRGWGWASG